MSPKYERIFVILSLILVLLASYFFYNFLTFKSNQINTAQRLLSEYKVSKALQILNNLKSKLSGKDIHVEFLTLYALVKAKKFKDAEEQLNELERISKKYKDKVSELVEVLDVNDQIKLINKLIAKSPALRFSEDYFIELSAQRNSLDAEMQVLQNGLKYLRDLKYKDKQIKKRNKNKEEVATRKIENYTLKRCIENSNIFMGTKQYKTAMAYLNKAKNLNIVENSTYKDDYYYNLALVYKNQGEFALAWDNMKLSAKLGNERAKSMITALNKRYRP